MRSFLSYIRLLREEDGAVTVDWVVLTAAVILLGTVAGGAVMIALPPLSEKLGNTLQAISVGNGH